MSIFAQKWSMVDIKAVEGLVVKSLNSTITGIISWHSFVALQFGHVEIWISIICCCLLQTGTVEKIKTNIQNWTCPNWWAGKDIRGCFIYILDSSNSSSFTFWSSQFAFSCRSNWTGIWTGNSNGTWTDHLISVQQKKLV